MCLKPSWSRNVEVWLEPFNLSKYAVTFFGYAKHSKVRGETFDVFFAIDLLEDWNINEASSREDRNRLTY